MAWLATPLVILAALLIEARFVAPPKNRFAATDVAVIGSSLVAHALPEVDQAPGNRKLRRVGIAKAEERELLVVLDEAIAAKVPLILLEAAPWIVDFKIDADQDCRQRGATLREAIRKPQVAVVDRLRRLFGFKISTDGMGEPAALDQAQTIDPVFLATFYPLRLHPPCHAEVLEAALAKARAQGTRVVFVQLPRSAVGEQWLGQAQSRELAAATQALAQRYGLDLFAVDGPWPNRLFSDHAHFNRAGRAQYRQALWAWLERQP